MIRVGPPGEFWQMPTAPTCPMCDAGQMLPVGVIGEEICSAIGSPTRLSPQLIEFRCPSCGLGQRVEVQKPKPPASRESVEAAMRAIAAQLIEATPQGWGFILLLAEFGGPGGLISHATNIVRADAVAVLEQYLDRMKQQVDSEPSPD